MPEDKNDSAYSAPVRQPVKGEKEKTMAEGHTTNISQIDVTKPLTQTQMAILSANSDSTRSVIPPSPDSVANYYPGKYQKHEVITKDSNPEKTYVVQEGESIGKIADKFGLTKEILIAANPTEVFGNERKYFITGHSIIIPTTENKTGEKIEELEVGGTVAAEEATEETIVSKPETPSRKESSVRESGKTGEAGKKKQAVLTTSYVGAYTSKKESNKIANLAKDVAYVQKRFLDLEILSEEHYSSEKPKTLKGEIHKSKIPRTIAAILWFQEYIMGATGKRLDGYLSPGKDTIKLLAKITIEQKESIYTAFVEAQKLAAEAKARDEAEAEIKAKAEAEMQLKIAQKNMKASLRALMIMNESPSYANVTKHKLLKVTSAKFGEFLKDYALYNPKFVERAYQISTFSETDNITRAMMKHMSDTEVARLSPEIKKLLYSSLDWGWTTKSEEDLMKRLMPEKFDEKQPAKEKEKTNEEHIIGDAAKDKEFMKKVFTYTKTINGAVGKGKTNNKEDVKLVAERLNEMGINGIPQESIDSGEWQDELTEKIKEYKNSESGAYYSIWVYTRKTPQKKKATGIINPGDPTCLSLFKSTGITPIHRSRRRVNSFIKGKKIKLNGDVGIGKDNNPEDVKIVAELLIKNKIPDVPEVSLNDGIWDNKLKDCLNVWEDRKGLSKAGWINDSGTHIKELGKYSGVGSISEMEYDMLKGTHKTKETRKEYNAKLDKLQENLGIEKGSKLDKVIAMANKAATDEEYYKSLTSDIKEKLTGVDSKKKDGDVTLSPLLIERARRFHKFLVAAGLYSGNASATDGARDKKRAHRWSVEYVIESTNATSSQKEAIWDNLIMMYSKDIYREKEYVIDLDDNKWAKEEHFYKYTGNDPGYKSKSEYDAAREKAASEEKKEEKKDTEKKEETKDKDIKIGIFKNDVVEFVKEHTSDLRDDDKSMFRNDSGSAASEGYKGNDSHRLPNKLGDSPSFSDHCSGSAIDISSGGMLMKSEAMIDLIALRFGLIRDGGGGEGWHFEMTGVEASEPNKKYLGPASKQEVVKSNKNTKE